LTWVTGEEWKNAEIKEVAERIVLLNRVLNVKMGVDARQDDLPTALKKPLTLEGNIKKIEDDELKMAIQHYYRIRGWDRDGIPTQETMKKLLPELT
jgi:aldehyde:ferredoxin oxidoreductase